MAKNEVAFARKACSIPPGEASSRLVVLMPGDNAGGGKNNDMGSVRADFIKKAYDQYADELSRYLRSTSFYGNEEANDIVQMTFVRLASLAKPEDIDNVRGFLYKTAKHIAIDQSRRRQTQEKYIQQKLQEEDGNPLDELSPEQIALHSERLQILEKAILKLPPRRRRVFVLNRVHNLSYDEIARETGLSKEGVRKHIARAMAVCEKALGKMRST